MLFFILGYFLPFYLPNSLKNQNVKKWNKHLEISSFYDGEPKIMIICYIVSKIWCMTDVIAFHFGPFLCFFTTLITQKIKILKIWIKCQKTLSFYACVPWTMIIWQTEFLVVLDRFFFRFAPVTTQKIKIKKKKKKKKEKYPWRYHWFYILQ